MTTTLPIFKGQQDEMDNMPTLQHQQPHLDELGPSGSIYDHQVIFVQTDDNLFWTVTNLSLRSLSVSSINLVLTFNLFIANTL